MPTPPEIPAAALAAASDALLAYEANASIAVAWNPEVYRGSADARARAALGAAIKHLLPGLYVTRDGRDATIWAEMPERVSYPEGLLMRTEANARLFDMLAALLPDRTDDDAEG